MRIFLYFAAILFAVFILAGCKKDSDVTPVTYKVIKLAPADSTNLDGGKNPPVLPPH